MRSVIPRLAAVSLVLTVVAACAATPKPGSPEAAALAHEEQQKATHDEVKSVVSEAPDWYIKPPQDDQKLFAPGTATSGDLQLAMDESALAAKRTLADSLKGLLSGKMKQFVSESGTSDAIPTKEVESVTTDVITEANVSGYRQVQAKVIPEGTKYRAYVLIEYSMAQANQGLADRVKQDPQLESKLRASKAFEDLEKDIQKSHDEKAATPDGASQ
jgi:hypothetical protein